MECAVWRWLPHRLLKFQSLYITVLFRTYTLTRTITFHLHLLINFTVYTHTYTLLFSSFYFGFVNMFLLLIRVKPLLASTNFVALTVALTNCMNNLAARILSYSVPETQKPGNEVAAGSPHFCKIYRKSSIKPPFSNKPPFPFFQGKKVNKPLFHSPNYSSIINDRLYQWITTVTLRVDWSGMVYLPTGSSDLILILGCMTSNFLYLNFSTLYPTIVDLYG